MWVAVFKSGTWTDSSGTTKTWSTKDIDKIVETYDPAKSEAPVVIGHPKDNAPAYGWVETLKRDGEMLWAKLKNIAPEFREWLDKSLYKKRSISLYPDGTLRHIGFLGAVPPAVKGLPDPAFKDGAGGAEGLVEIAIDYAVGSVSLNKAGYDHATSLVRAGKVNTDASWSISAADENAMLGDPPNWEEYAKWFLGEDTSQAEETKGRYKYPFGKGGKVYRAALVAIRTRAAQQDIDSVFDAAGRLLETLDVKEGKNMSEVELEKLKLRYAEKEKSLGEALEALKAELEKAKADKEASDKERADFAAKFRRQEVEAYCAKLETENKIPPAFRERGLVEFLVALEGQDSEITFAEGKAKQTPKVWFREFLEALPETVPLGAQFTHGAPGGSDDKERALGFKIAGVNTTQKKEG